MGRRRERHPPLVWVLPAVPVEPDEIRWVTWRARELANADWTEQEAGEELARLMAGDRRLLEAAHRHLQATLVRSPWADLQAIRVCRVLRAALLHREALP